MKTTRFAIVILSVLMGAPAKANDSSAELATGGLVFEKNSDIEMRTEQLYISAKEIRVSARLFNKSAKDVTTWRPAALLAPNCSGLALLKSRNTTSARAWRSTTLRAGH